jgi:hypothetical protein
MKWVLLVVMMSSEGNLEKVMNGGFGWDLRSDCAAAVELQHVEIIESFMEYYSGFTKGAEILGVGCYQPLTQQEDLIVLY